MRRGFITLLVLLISCSSVAQDGGNTRIDSFRAAKKILRKLYQNHRITFYCGCSYSGKQLDHASCGYKPKRTHYKSGKRNTRAYRIEWEHVVPAYAFAKSFPEYQTCKRKCLKKRNKLFARMEADLYNLVPAIGEVNGNRSNYSMADIPGEVREYGSCDVEIKGRKVEPRPAVRGNIARTYLYMDWAYPGRGIITAQERKLFEAWDKADLVDEWECERARLIEKVQGNENPFVKKKCSITK
jgi:deoxyribonuclease I